MDTRIDTLYTADYVVTQNDARGVIRHGALAVAGDRIACVGHCDLLEILYPEARRVDLGEAAIMPGLVNAHTHVPMSLLRGFSDDKALMDWLTKDIFPQEAKLTPELVELGALFSFAEMLRGGTTAFFDMYMHERAVFRAADRIGIRGVLGESTTQYFPSLSCKNEDEYAELARALAADCEAHPLLRAAIVPHAPYTTNPALLQRCRALADETGALFGMHLAETRSETESCLRDFGLRPVPYCESLGLLRPDTTFFHMVEAQEDELDLLAANGCAITHCPASNMKLASGVAPLAAMVQRGIGVGLGTDGPASNNAQNMLREMYAASLLHKVDGLDPQACPAQLALDLATRGGAAALHEPFIGTLEPGMKADFIALGLSAPNMQPVHNIVSNIVYAATGAENRLTVIDGRELYRDGKWLSCDYEALREEMKGVLDWARKK